MQAKGLVTRKIMVYFLAIVFTAIVAYIMATTSLKGLLPPINTCPSIIEEDTITKAEFLSHIKVASKRLYNEVKDNEIQSPERYYTDSVCMISAKVKGDVDTGEIEEANDVCTLDKSHDNCNFDAGGLVGGADCNQKLYCENKMQFTGTDPDFTGGNSIVLRASNLPTWIPGKSVPHLYIWKLKDFCGTNTNMKQATPNNLKYSMDKENDYKTYSFCDEFPFPYEENDGIFSKDDLEAKIKDCRDNYKCADDFTAFLCGGIKTVRLPNHVYLDEMDKHADLTEDLLEDWTDIFKVIGTNSWFAIAKEDEIDVHPDKLSIDAGAVGTDVVFEADKTYKVQIFKFCNGLSFPDDTLTVVYPGDQIGKTCTSSVECGANLFCAAWGECKAKLDNGAACVLAIDPLSEQEASSLSCKSGFCKLSTGKCEEMPTQVPTATIEADKTTADINEATLSVDITFTFKGASATGGATLDRYGVDLYGLDVYEASVDLTGKTSFDVSGPLTYNCAMVDLSPITITLKVIDEDGLIATDTQEITITDTKGVCAATSVTKTCLEESNLNNLKTGGNPIINGNCRMSGDGGYGGKFRISILYYTDEENEYYYCNPEANLITDEYLNPGEFYDNNNNLCKVTTGEEKGKCKVEFSLSDSNYKVCLSDIT